ncbi:MAG TPA: hypothetical protein VFT12_05670 [Thermoanaerobaculia bacterium]|nr:hypothetical protein [Thermoanaerobaculia bacterium]
MNRYAIRCATVMRAGSIPTDVYAVVRTTRPIPGGERIDSSLSDQEVRRRYRVTCIYELGEAGGTSTSTASARVPVSGSSTIPPVPMS